MKFEELKKPIILYAGEMSPNVRKVNKMNFYGVSITNEDMYHVKHDITQPYDLPDNSVALYQAEDVFQCIPKDKFIESVNEIYRILELDGVFRLSLPDYHCDILRERVRRDEEGNICFDPAGGGSYDEENKCVINGGALWFPTIDVVRELLDETDFDVIECLQYYENDDDFVMGNIDYAICHVKRTPDHDERVKNPKRPMSIVIDCYKINE